MADYAPRVKKKLRENGFSYYKSGKGDHEKWKNQDGKMVIVDHKNFPAIPRMEFLNKQGLRKPSND